MSLFSLLSLDMSLFVKLPRFISKFYFWFASAISTISEQIILVIEFFYHFEFRQNVWPWQLESYSAFEVFNLEIRFFASFFNLQQKQSHLVFRCGNQCGVIRITQITDLPLQYVRALTIRIILSFKIRYFNRYVFGVRHIERNELFYLYHIYRSILFYIALRSWW